MKVFPGRKLDFECKNCERKRSEREFMTLVEFSVEHPYGKALALLDLRSGLVKVCHYARKSLAENPSLGSFLVYLKIFFLSIGEGRLGGPSWDHFSFHTF